MKRRFLYLTIISLTLVLLSGCSFFFRDTTTENTVITKKIDVGAITVEDLQTLVQETIAKVENTVIAITYTEGVFPQTTSLGSGVIIERSTVLKDKNGSETDENIDYYDYLVITNRNVVMYKNRLARNLKAYLGNVDLSLDGSCVYYDRNVDLALVNFKTTVYLPVASIGDSTTLKKGSFAIALGNPYDLGFYSSATFGIVSHPLRYLTDDIFESSSTKENVYIQHDVAINSGNSGGGLFDIYGNLIGINTMKIIGQENDIENMGFSIPSETVKQIIAKYKS